MEWYWIYLIAHLNCTFACICSEINNTKTITLGKLISHLLLGPAVLFLDIVSEFDIYHKVIIDLRKDK